MTLYEIDERLNLLEEFMCDPDTGELLSEEEFNQKFDEIQMSLNEKIENSMCFYKSLMAEVEAFKKEKANLEQRRKVKENLAERIKKRIDDYIIQQYTDDHGVIDTASLNKFKFETPRLKLSYRKSDIVNIKDVTKIPNAFIKERTLKEDDVMKAELKKSLKNGDNIEGAELVNKLNMQVK